MTYKKLLGFSLCHLHALGAGLDQRIPSLCVVLTWDLAVLVVVVAVGVAESACCPSRLFWSGKWSTFGETLGFDVGSDMEVSRPEEFKNRTISYSVMHVAHGS